MTPDDFDYDHLLKQNLYRVFNERDPDLRLQALGELYTADATLIDPEAVTTGHAAISEHVGTLLSTLPPDFMFVDTGTAVGHHGAARLRWQAGPAGGPVALTGTDVVLVEEGRIKVLYVFLDPPLASATSEAH